MGSSANTHALIAARLGYNGEHHEPTSAWQSLGNGHRIYNPVLMRFHSADHESPFARGGINAYAYCGSEPVNRIDPSGRRFFLLQYKFKYMPVATMFTGLTGALAAGAVAVSTPNDDARKLAIAGVIAALTVVGLAGRYTWIKRRYRDPTMSRTARAQQRSGVQPKAADTEKKGLSSMEANGGDGTPPRTPQTASTTLGSPTSTRKSVSSPSGSPAPRKKSVAFAFDEGQPQPVRETVSDSADKLRRASLMEKYRLMGRRDSHVY